MFEEFKIIDGVWRVKTSPNGEFREISKERLTEKIVELSAELQLMRLQNSSVPVVHRCVRCGCTSTVVDEIASHPAYGC